MRLKNPHTVVKNKYVPRPQQQTVKPTTRSFESEVRVTTEEPRKVVENKPEPKKQETVTNTVVKPPTTTGETAEIHKLNGLTTRILALHLTKLMKKTFQNIDDDATDETERRFTDILKHEIAPDLIKVIGLNVTKRLLNVHNPLNVEIQFNGKPDKLELREFLKKYNFIGFSRKAVNIFAAQLKSINDFDRLCSEEEVRCGSVTVSVSPEYKFAKCPINIKTKYRVDDLEELVDNVKIYEAFNKVQDKKIPETCKITISPEKQEKLSPTNNKLETVKSDKINEEITIVQAAPLQNKVGKSNVVTKAVETGNKPAENIAGKETTNKQELPKVKIENKIVTPPKPETKIATLQKQTTVTAKAVLEGATLIKTVTKDNPTTTASQISVAKSETKMDQTKGVMKVPPHKGATPIKTVTKNNPTTTISQISPIKTETKMDQTKAVMKVPPHKSAVKASPIKVKQGTYSKLATPKKPMDDEDDYDELDDHDILALMSEGIVLDECCGSDEE